jgi:hypothetical protein
MVNSEREVVQDEPQFSNEGIFCGKKTATGSQYASEHKKHPFA